MTTAILFTIILSAFFLFLLGACRAAGRADETARRAYLNTHSPVPCSTGELVNRINVYRIRQVAEAPYPERIQTYQTRIKKGDKVIKVFVVDGREAWMEKMGIYSEQCELMLTEIKSILAPNGVS